jgi:hypothetical protein
MIRIKKEMYLYFDKKGEEIRHLNGDANGKKLRYWVNKNTHVRKKIIALKG